MDENTPFAKQSGKKKRDKGHDKSFLLCNVCQYVLTQARCVKNLDQKNGAGNYVCSSKYLFDLLQELLLISDGHI